MADKSLLKKVRLKEPDASLVLNAPVDILERLMPVQTEVQDRKFSFVLLFVHSQAELRTHLPRALAALDDDPVFWIAYPKKSSPLASDINRDTGWEPVFEAGYGPVSQVAIDTTFSALRFRPEKDVKRKEGSVIKSMVRK